MGAKKSKPTHNMSEVTYELKDADNGSNIGIYYINLDDRVDRRIEIEAELKKMNLQGNRIAAIKDTPGIVGCAKSHIKALEKGLKDGVDHILIFEDDFYFTTEPHVLQQVFDQLIKKNYDVFMLGYCIFESAEKSLFPTNHGLFKKIKQACCAHGYVINKKYAQKLLHNLKEGLFLRIKTKKQKHNNDEHWKLLQNNDMWLCYSKGPLGMQKVGFSDIDNQIKWDNPRFVTDSLGIK